MPQFNVTTVSGNQIWASPDGQRKIYEVVVDYQGKHLKGKTYSDAIARPGWSGEVLTYEKENRSGSMDTFLKQPPKEGGGYGGSSGGSTGRSYSGSPKDEKAIQAMWAISQAVAALKISDAALDPADIKAMAVTMFSMVDEVKTGEAPQDTVHDVPDEPLSLADLDAALGGEPVDAGETPWPNNN